MSDHQAIIRLENITFGYAGCGLIFDQMNFELFKDDKIGFYGDNGSGKTTFFRLICGLLKPRDGRITLHGDLVYSEKDFQRLRRKVGFVLQNADDQLFCPTVLEDVAFGPLNLGLNPEEARQRALETLESVGLGGYDGRFNHQLSGGEKKLVSLAAVLSMRPEVLLLDEPSNDLDQRARERLINVLNASQTTQIIISHDWGFLSKTATSYITVSDGKLVNNPPMSHHSHQHMHPFGDKPHTHDA